MTSNNRIWSSVGADYAVSKHQTDNKTDLSTVTLSHSEGSVAMVVEILRGVYTERSERALHDSTVTHQRQHCHPEPQRRVCLDGRGNALLGKGGTYRPIRFYGSFLLDSVKRCE
jgi:hypothetical protein